jgi:1,4-dihydroxy-2-naphthoate octaprenyltransferase
VSSSFLKSCLLAARPKTLVAAIVPVWLGCVLAWKMTGLFDLWLAFCTLGGAIAIQTATNFFNDAIDAQKGADTKQRLGPTRVTSSGLMSVSRVMQLASLFLVIAFTLGSYLYQVRGWPIWAMWVPSLFLTYGYTGGPFPLAYRGMGEIFVVLFFGFVAVCGTVFIQTNQWPAEAWLLGLQTGLYSAVLISINNLRDRQEDSTTGKRTLAVRFGARFAKLVIGFEILGAALSGLAWIAFGYAYLALACLPTALIGFRILRGIIHLPPGPAYNRLLSSAGIQLFVFAAAYHFIAALA